MTAPNGSTIEYSIKGEPRKLGVGRRQLRDFRNTRRIQAVQLAEEDGAPAVARLIRCCTRYVRDWLNSWHRGGGAALREKDRRPKHPYRIPEEKIGNIVQIRDRQGYGCAKIAFDVMCSSSTAHKYLKIHGRNHQTGKRHRYGHFERQHSNALWQMDYAMLRKDIWVLQIVDDHSRFIVGSRVLRSPDAKETMALLQECFSDFGTPDQFLTDHGSQFYAVRGGVCEFDTFCIEHLVQHILESITHPQTLGKTEQRHNMLKNHLSSRRLDVEDATNAEIIDAVKEFTHWHNYDSPHEGWLEYRFGDLVKRKMIHFIPFLRFVNHRS